MKLIILTATLIASAEIQAKEMALSFDDSPMATTKHFETNERTDKLIQKLKELNAPSVMIFANPCKRNESSTVIDQLKKYRAAGHFIGNHTCSHPRLDDVGFNEYSQNAAQADKLLAPLFAGQKFFRFPYLNESKDEKLRDQMRDWLQANHYRNGLVSIDTDDYLFSFKINEAKKKGHKIDYQKVETLFLEHVIGAVKFYDELAVKTIGYSPKHVLLLHEMDATVLYIDSLIKALRTDGWKMISIEKAYQDKVYLEQPKNIDASNGIIAQISKEKTGAINNYNSLDKMTYELDKLLGLAK